MVDSLSWRECSKKFVQQGRSLFGARSVHSVREHGKRARTPLAAFFNIPLSYSSNPGIHDTVFGAFHQQSYLIRSKHMGSRIHSRGISY